MFEIGDLVHVTARIRSFLRYSDRIHLVLSKHTYLDTSADLADSPKVYYTLLNQATGRKVTIPEWHITSTEDYWNRKTYFEEDYRSLP